MAVAPDPKDPPRSTPASGATIDDGGGRRIGKYQIQKKIGAGGMGAVFLAIDPALKRAVALKVLPHDKASNPTLVKRFKAEAQSAANLRHDNIVMVYEAGEADGLLYIALEYVEGIDVANLLQKRGVMPVKRSIDVVRQIALALQHAHKQGIVHRDIKPGNILIRRDGVAKLADLGLARAVDEHADTSITRAGTTVGTVDYMAPEQARNSKAADVRSDLYSLGCTWYFMLTGEPPFPDGSMTNKLRSHAETPIPDPRRINPAVTEAVVAVMRRMTEKDPARRYQAPDELMSDLETARVAGDLVSEAILGEMDEEADSRAGKRKSARSRTGAVEELETQDAGKSQRRPAVAAEESSAPDWKPPRQEKDRPSFEWARAIPFYAILVLLAGGVLAGAGWLVQQFGSSVTPPTNEGGGNPFAERAPLEGQNSEISAQAISGDHSSSTESGADPAHSGQVPQSQGQVYQGQATATRTTSVGEQPANTVIVGSHADPGQKAPGGSQPVSAATGRATSGTATSPLNATGGKLPASTTPQSGVESTGTSESSENPAEGRASPVVSAATAAFMARRPRLPPESPVSAENSEPIRIDLTRDDLGRVLAGRKLRNGAQITASGFGPRQSSPIVVENVWIRLKFEQTEGPPLVLSPKSHESVRQEAFITVRNGGLEITGGAFNASMTEKSGARSFLQVVDSDLALRNCRIQGPASSGTHGRGLIQWTRAGGHPQERLFAGEYEGYAAVDNCFLVGSGTLLEADLSRRALFIRNSALIARDDLLAVNLRSADSQVGGAIDLETTTLSAAGSFFRITAATLDIPTDTPMTVFADRCVFGPPVHSGKQPVQPTLVSYAGPLLETRQLDWWENHSGYASDIKSFLRADDVPVEPQDFERQWQSRWDAGQIVEPLTGPQGVVLNQDLPQRPEDRLKLEPADFALYPASRAATWDAGKPIGAPISDLHIPGIRSEPRPAPAKTAPKSPKPGKSAPAGKPKVSF